MSDPFIPKSGRLARHVDRAAEHVRQHPAYAPASDPASGVMRSLRDADDALGLAVEAPGEAIAAPYLRRAVGHLIHAVEQQQAELGALRGSVRAAHDQAAALDQRTAGMRLLG